VNIYSTLCTIRLSKRKPTTYKTEQMLGSLDSVSAITLIPSSFKELSLTLSDKQHTV